MSNEKKVKIYVHTAFEFCSLEQKMERFKVGVHEVSEAFAKDEYVGYHIDQVTPVEAPAVEEGQEQPSEQESESQFTEEEKTLMNTNDADLTKAQRKEKRALIERKAN